MIETREYEQRVAGIRGSRTVVRITNDRGMRMRKFAASAWVLLALATGCFAADDDAAELKLRIKPGDTLHYTWTITANSSSTGRHDGQPFTLSNDSVFTMTLQIKGLPAKGEQTPVSLRLQNISYTDRRSIGDDVKTELTVSREKVKYTENGKVLIDSENDIGTDSVSTYLDQMKLLETGEAHTLMDASGRQSEMQGESAMVEMFRSGGAQTIFPLLAGKSVKPGESWQDTFSMPNIGDFKLAKPAVVHSKVTFAKWETKDGKKLAQLELVSAMEHTELKGENPRGMLAEISHVNDTVTGTALFDPATGYFVEGTITNDEKYHIDGELDGQKQGMDKSGKSTVSFVKKEK